MHQWSHVRMSFHTTALGARVHRWAGAWFAALIFALMSGGTGTLHGSEDLERVFALATPLTEWQLDGIRAALQDPSPMVRAEAAYVCGARYWSRRCLQMTVLMPLLQNPDSEVRITAMMGLRSMGPLLTPEAGRLLTVMIVQQENPDLSWKAIHALDGLGPQVAPMVLPHVLPLLDKADAEMKRRIIHCVLETGRAAAPYATALLPLLNETDLEMRELVLRALRDMDIGQARPPNAAKVAPAVARALLPLLKDPDPAIRYKIPALLGTLGPEAASITLPILLPMLDDPAEDSAFFAEDLAHLGKAAPEVVLSHLLPRLQQAEAHVRRHTLIVLSCMGPAAAPCVADIRPLLRDPDSGVRSFAISLLTELSAGSDTFFKDIFPLLQDADTRVQCTVIDALSKMGSDHAPAVVRALLPLLNPADGDMRRSVRSAFVPLRQAALILSSQLAPALEKANPWMQLPIIEALSPIPTDAQAAPFIRILRPYLQEKEADLRHAAARVLAGIGTGPQTTAFIREELLPLLQDQDEKMRAAVLHGLPFAFHAGHIQPLLHSTDSNVRNDVLCALMRMGEKAAPYVAELLPLVQDPRSPRYEPVYEVFKTMGAAAAPVLHPAMLQMLSQPDRQDRHLIGDYLDELGNLTSSPAWHCAALAAVHSLASARSAPRSDAHDLEQLRVHLYLWSGRDPTLLLSVRWLGKPAATPMPAGGAALTAAEQHAVLHMLHTLWPHSAKYPALRQEMAARIADVAQNITTATEEKTAALLKSLDEQFKADTVKKNQPASAKARAAVEGALVRVRG